ncbi:MAG: ornithine cyclodeaminase family protein [Polyangiales bacterium]
MQTLLLTQAQVRSVLQMSRALPAVEQAFAAHGRGESKMPAKVYLALEHHDGDFRAMPAYLGGSAGVKWVSSHPNNPSTHGLPAVMGLYILSDPSTALPLAVMDATLLTAIRTGAAAGVAAKHLATEGASTVSFIGCGVQARHLLEAHRVALGDGFDALMADVSRDAAERFAQQAGGRAVSIEEAAGADVVCTATPSRKPLVKREWIRDGALINAMGADAPGKQELDPQILLDARVVIDDWEQATESGEVNVPLHVGTLTRGGIVGTIGEVVAGRVKGRESDDDIVVFDSTGLAIQDVALARVVYEAARNQGTGTEIELTANKAT